MNILLAKLKECEEDYSRTVSISTTEACYSGNVVKIHTDIFSRKYYIELLVISGDVCNTWYIDSSYVVSITTNARTVI